MALFYRAITFGFGSILLIGGLSYGIGTQRAAEVSETVERSISVSDKVLFGFLNDLTQIPTWIPEIATSVPEIRTDQRVVHWLTTKWGFRFPIETLEAISPTLIKQRFFNPSDSLHAIWTFKLQPESQSTTQTRITFEIQLQIRQPWLRLFLSDTKKLRVWMGSHLNRLELSLAKS